MAALLEKSDHAAEDFLKNGELRYRTFKKKFAKVAGLLEKKSGHDPGIMGKNPAHTGGAGPADHPILLIRATLIRARIEPGFTLGRSNRSPYRTPFQNKPKYALFWKTDE